MIEDRKEHTPGPWIFQPAADGIVEENVVVNDGPGSAILAHCVGEANGHLIAAAPDLLNALETLVLTGDAHGDKEKWTPRLDMSDIRIVLARNAIAKARGMG